MDLIGRHVVVANWRDPDHSLAGGAERYAWEFACALVAAGARVDFLTAREAGQRRSELRDGIRILRRGGRLGFYPSAALHLLRHRRRVDAVVDAEAGIPTFSPLFVSRRTGVVLLMHHVHQTQFDTYFPRPLAVVGRLLERVAMPRVYRGRPVLAVSESTRTEMARQLGWTPAVTVLPNGTAAVVRRDVPAEDTVDRVVVLGRLATHKRVDLVVRAVAALVPLRPALHLDVVGRGPEMESLAALVDTLDVAKHVTLHGYLDEADKADLMTRARLHVCASDAEGWGQVVVEAASYGVPTVARDVPGMRDSVRDTTTGWLLREPADDLVAVQARLLAGIEQALEELDDEERREEIAVACRAWAARFSWEEMHDGAVAAVLQALEKGGTSCPPSQ
ncbi:glycosyltransferase family 4 protein [Nocardioides terrisoli]|uniref:glycosyltransferase family 4 protein n=1 Tax=Nocardioides terrisoli TaxID=3388267 RepID=UPI00287B9F20|nr:glycosyltransferase family 4 protein [Nocardioides marmorisolisilvae]